MYHDHTQFNLHQVSMDHFFSFKGRKKSFPSSAEIAALWSNESPRTKKSQMEAHSQLLTRLKRRCLTFLLTSFLFFTIVDYQKDDYDAEPSSSSESASVGLTASRRRWNLAFISSEQRVSEYSIETSLLDPVPRSLPSRNHATAKAAQ